jgi:prepilin-type processing-associated H-X9-DG protein
LDLIGGFVGIAVFIIGPWVALLGIGILLGWVMSAGVQKVASAARRGRAEGRTARIAGVIVGSLGVTASSLTLPMYAGYVALWNRSRIPPDVAHTGYRLPPLDPNDAVRFALWWALGGLVLGAVALVVSPSRRGGRWSIALAFGFATVSAVLPFGSRERERPEKAVCLSNVKNIALAIQMYAVDNDDMLPSADAWCDQVGGYTKNRGVFLCERSWGTPSAYAYNDTLNRASLAHLGDTASLIAIFESNAGWNAHGGPELLVTEPRHLGGDNWAFADGHVRWISRSKLSAEEQYRWER